jgi:hypothetical protein
MKEANKNADCVPCFQETPDVRGEDHQMLPQTNNQFLQII